MKNFFVKESEEIDSCNRAIETILTKALALQDTLRAQRDQLKRASSGLTSITEAIPGINNVASIVTRRKTSENVIVAIALLMCITFW